MDEKLELSECNLGPVFAELSLLSDIFLPIKSSARIKYLSFDVSKYFIVFGASSGSIYIFQRSPIKFLQVLANKDGAVNQISLAPDDNLIGYSTSKGLLIVLEHNLYKRGNQIPKRLQLSYEHKGSLVTALQWNSASSRLFAGDDRGRVSVINILTSKAKILLQLPTVVIMRLDSRIIQLDFAQNKLVASTMTKCYICDTSEEQYKHIGKKPRDGAFGVCFFVASKTQTPSIYATRPGSRLWEVDFQGTVLNTHQFKDALALSPQIIISKGCESKLLSLPGNYPPQNVNFGKILSLGDKYLITWTDNAIYIVDPANASVVLWTDNLVGIREIKIYKHDLFVWLADGTVRNIRLISPAKLTRKLIARQEYLIAAHMAVKYQSTLSNSESRHQLPAKLLRQLQSQLLEISETQLANCVDLLTTQIETLDSSSVSSSVSGRSGSTDSFSRHESGVLIVHPSPRNSTSAASDSDDDLMPRTTRVRFGHVRSVSTGRSRPGSAPRTTSTASPFRPISPGASLTLPRQPRPKSASPAVSNELGLEDGINDLSKAKSYSREKVGAKISAFERVAKRGESPTKIISNSRLKGRVVSDTASKLGVKVPLVNDNTQQLQQNKMAENTEKLAVTKRLPKKPSSFAPNVNNINNINKNVNSTSLEKGTITFTFPTYPCMSYGIEPPVGGGNDNFLSVTIETPTVLSDLKDSVASTIQSGKQTLRGTVEAIEEKIKKLNENEAEELFDVRRPDDKIKIETYESEVPKCRQELFRTKYFKNESLPKINVDELISKSRRLNLTSNDENRQELVKDWSKTLNICRQELTDYVLRLANDESSSSSTEWENVIFIDDPFNMAPDDHVIVSSAAMCCFKNFAFAVDFESFSDGNHETSIEKLNFTPFNEKCIEIDRQRSKFVTKFGHLLNMDDCREFLFKSTASRYETWCSLIICAQEKMVGDPVFDNCLSINSSVDVSVTSSKDNDIICRSIALIKRVMSINMSLGFDMCARKSNVTSPIDVMYLCRSIGDKSANYFEVYINKMMTGCGLHSVQMINYLSNDDEFLFTWFCILVSKNSNDANCSCGYPRPGAHHILWPNGNILWHLVRKKCRYYKTVMELAFKYGYWPGFLYLCRQMNERRKLMEIVVQLGDIELIDKDSEFGFFPQNDEEWNELISLVAKTGDKCLNCERTLQSVKNSTISWTRIAYLLLQYWGPREKTLDLLRKVEELIPPAAISVEFLQNFLALAVVQSQQSKSGEVWRENASFLGSEMFHVFQLEKHQSTSTLDTTTTTTNSSPSLIPSSNNDKPNDAPCHWGANLRLHDDCVACCLPLILGTAASVHGVVILRCGHAFHQSCLENQICTLCENK